MTMPGKERRVERDERQDDRYGGSKERKSVSRYKT